jgi:rRNA-processing protein FCF1
MIGIVIDTNIINSGSNNFMIAQFSSKLDDIIRALESTDNYQEVKILLPKIVIQELYQHQLSNYQKRVDSLKGLKIPGLDYTQENDYPAMLTRYFDETIANLTSRTLQTEIIDYPKDSVLPNIIERALLKQAPFEGVDKVSDKGFKDVILWESILEYKRQHHNDTLILFTSDIRLCCSSLENEYQTLFHDNIYLLHQTTSNDYSILYDKVSTLLENKSTNQKTFDEENKQRLLELLNTDNVSYLFEDLPIETDEGTLICLRVDLKNKSIANITDLPDENKIKYIVNLELSVDAKSEDGECYWEDSAELTIDYYFENDTFYLQQMCGLDYYWEYKEKGLMLTDE